MTERVKSQKDFSASNDVIDQTNEMSVYTWLLRFTEGASSVLDIGCAGGFFDQHLVARGQRVIGTELNPASAAQAHNVCHKVILGDIETPEVQSKIRERFDAVVLGDVLEHLQKPTALLVYIRKAWLKSSGWVVLSVPNSAHWVFRREVLLGRFPYRQCGLFDKTHLRFFTHNSLCAMIDRAGYYVDREARTTNGNHSCDITFSCLKPLYRRLDCRHWLKKFERCLGTLMPNLFAYQFVLKIRPRPEYM
jgi:2-polyprenyl-3-methyl-5-hydroxy-6-metoxy-1,4-benzoquinol methylase